MRFLLTLVFLVSFGSAAFAGSISFLNHHEFIIVLAQWEKKSQDIDLWIKGPGESKPVGYSHRHGDLFVLLKAQRSTFEMAYSKGVPDGNYSAVLECYKCKKSAHVTLTVRIKASGRIVSESKTDVRLHKKKRKRLQFVVKEQSIVGGIQDRSQ